jgi:hemerythrin
MAEWTPDLTVNHDILDRQHIEIFRKIQEAAARLEAPAAELAASVSALSDELVAHITTEERIMADALYPERKRHGSAHELFMADFQRMREELHREGVTSNVAEWIRRRTPDWLGFHIRVNDVPLGEFLSRRRGAGADRAPSDRGRSAS